MNSLINYEKIPDYKYDLAAYKKFLRKIGSPNRILKNVILIAGTKGKGSTAAIISSCLIAHGFKVGLYTSPHLNRINERIEINNCEISSRELNRYIQILKPHINLKTRVGARTFFEVLTAVAFLHFAESNLDFVILEVGLGGRLDATNVVNPLISVITRIGYDHRNLLGNKLSQIAYEKAGIINKIPLNSPFRQDAWRIKGEAGGLVITIRQRPSVEKILKRIANKRHCRLIFAELQHKVRIEKMSLKGSQIKISGELGNFKTFVPLVGKHQTENLLIAIAVLNELKKAGFNIKPQMVKRGIEKTLLPGRFEMVSKKPLVIYDVAHNQDSFKALYENIREICRSRAFRLVRNGAKAPTPKRVFYIIFGCGKDKDIRFCIKNIFPMAKEVVLVKALHPRAMEPLDICVRARQFQKNIVIAGSCREAIEYLRAKINRGSAIIVFGSFYLWNEMKKIGF